MIIFNKEFRKALIKLFIVFALVFSVFTIVRILFKFSLFDFNIYYQSVRDILRGSNVYLNANTDNNYPPTAFLFVFPFGLINQTLAEDLWTIFSFVCFLASLYFLVKILAVKSWTDILLIYSLAMLSFPFKFSFGLGQINLLILFFLILNFYFYKKGKNVWAGIFLSMASVIKLTPLILLLYFLRKSKFKLMISTVLSFIFLNFASVIFFGKDLFLFYYLNVFPKIPTIGNSSYYNQALSGFLARFGIEGNLGYLLNYGLLTLLIYSAIVIIKNKSEKNDLLEFGLFMIIIILGSGLAWQHHLVWLIIPYSTLFLELKKFKQLKWQLLFIISYLLVASNIKNPKVFDGLSILILSHGFYGTVILLYLVFTNVFNKKIKLL